MFYISKSALSWHSSECVSSLSLSLSLLVASLLSVSTVLVSSAALSWYLYVSFVSVSVSSQSWLSHALSQLSLDISKSGLFWKICARLFYIMFVARKFLLKFLWSSYYLTINLYQYITMVRYIESHHIILHHLHCIFFPSDMRPGYMSQQILEGEFTLGWLLFISFWGW